jgi:hypothetical protein
VCNVSISQELALSCPNWNSYEPETLRHRFFPCENLYWIYNVHLHCNNEYCIHQSTLVITKVENLLNQDSIPPKWWMSCAFDLQCQLLNLTKGVVVHERWSWQAKFWMISFLYQFVLGFLVSNLTTFGVCKWWHILKIY